MSTTAQFCISMGCILHCDENNQSFTMKLFTYLKNFRDSTELLSRNSIWLQHIPFENFKTECKPCDSRLDYEEMERKKRGWNSKSIPGQEMWKPLEKT
jgi:hypothetical protein